MRRQLIYNLFIAVFSSVLFSYIIYFGFISSYSVKVFSEESFLELYDSGVFKYRVLSKEIILQVNDFIEPHIDPNPPDLQMRQTIDKRYSHSFYVSYFIVNTFFLVLCSIIFVLIMELKQYLFDEKEKLLYLILFLSIVSISQFVVVPYDISSYFFLLLFVYFASIYFDNQSTKILIVLSFIIFLATLNRESAAIAIAYFGAVFLINQRSNRKVLVGLLLLIGTYIVTYIGLRLYIGNPDAYVWNTNRLLYNLTSERSYFGIVFCVLLFTIAIRLANNRVNRKLIYYFHLLCTPYFLLCLLTGILFEIRLYIPIFIVSLFITRYKSYLRIK